MYKWHVHSAVGRSRPVAKDITRVVDGIAASLRQFSISLSRSAEDANGANVPPPPSRSQRSAAAVSEASSLAPKPNRGIDARALAAQPPAFTITRYQSEGKVPAPTISRGGVNREFPRRIAQRGRPGQRGGRARGGARSRGKRRRESGDRVRGQAEDDDGPEPPMTQEEKNFIFHSECGFPHPYEPTTTADSLARYGGAVVSSPRGINETLMYKMQVASGIGPHYQHAGTHFDNMHFGNGLTIFEDPEQRMIAQRWKKHRKIDSLNEKDKVDVLGAWAAGHYQAPVSQKAGILGQVETYLRRNETYLPADARKLEAKLSTLLPAAAPAIPKQGKTAA